MIQEKLKGISEYSKQIDTHVDFVVDKFTYCWS